MMRLVITGARPQVYSRPLILKALLNKKRGAHYTYHERNRIDTVTLENVEDQNVTPVISPNRRVPFSIIPELKDTIKSIEKRNVIKKINEPIEWIKKPKGGHGLCLDIKNLNKALRREHHPIPNYN
ncbi:Reverse transcriptase domain-containing protein [Aphis craccivora]|uniref:Reverse transcriptase domain-containing protein n=1 Tax=Aphis craccivora TaxID=307492 RepID=A0A6G0Z1M0_APHCR|nr:Reverse transcriptase domain-containing protein [Aphis craccivora]